MDESLSLSKIEIELLREFLSLLSYEESLISSGNVEERKKISKQRIAIRKKLHSIDNNLDQLDLFESNENSSSLKKIKESLEKQIHYQKNRLVHLLKNKMIAPIALKEIQRYKEKKSKLLTLDPPQNQ